MKGKTSMFVFIIVLGTILTTSLTGIDSYTKPIIAKNAELKRKASILKAFDIPYTEATIEQVFLENVRGRGSGAEGYYMSTNLISFVFSGPGLWGPIEGVLAMDKDLREIQRITIMYQEETPGLGSRIAEPEFLARFKDKSFTPGLKLVAEGKASSSNEIDSVTGATMSSEALIAILNANYDKFSQIVSGE